MVVTQIGVKMDKIPKVHLKKRSDGRFYVELSSEGNRFRFTNGDSIGINIVHSIGIKYYYSNSIHYDDYIGINFVDL